jgi:hypothetical protein
VNSLKKKKKPNKHGGFNVFLDIYHYSPQIVQLLFYHSTKKSINLLLRVIWSFSQDPLAIMRLIKDILVF